MAGPLEGRVAAVTGASSGIGAATAVALSQAGAAVAVCHVDGRRWLTIEGRAVLRSDRASVAEAERRYA